MGNSCTVCQTQQKSEEVQEVSLKKQKSPKKKSKEKEKTDTTLISN